MIKTILKNWVKDKALLLTWSLLSVLCIATLRLSPENPLFSLVSLITKGHTEKIMLELFLILTGLLLSLYILHKRNNEKINIQTCEWIKDPPIWKHRTNGLYYCSRCAPNPSPLSSDYLCPKCLHSFGKGEAFNVPDSYD
jgi:hypothetical protein